MQKLRYAAITSVLTVAAGSAFAQFSADAKISGRAFRHYEAQTYQQHARNYSQMLYYEARCEQPATPQSAKQQIAGVRSNVAAANKALDQLKEAHAGKSDVAKSIDKIKERHAKVIAKCDELDQQLAKADKDTTVLCDCCVDIMDELDAAAAETDKLGKDLKIPEMPKPAKSGKGAPAKK